MNGRRPPFARLPKVDVAGVVEPLPREYVAWTAAQLPEHGVRLDDEVGAVEAHHAVFREAPDNWVKGRGFQGTRSARSSGWRRPSEAESAPRSVAPACRATKSCLRQRGTR